MTRQLTEHEELELADMERQAAFERLVLFGRTPADDVRDAAIRLCGARAIAAGGYIASRSTRAANPKTALYLWRKTATR